MVNSLKDAVALILRRKQGSVLVEWIEGRAGNICGIVKHENKNYFVFFSRVWLRNFGKIMRFGYEIEGTTIRTDIIERAMKLSADILIVKAPDDVVYTIEALRFAKYVKNNKTIYYNNYSRTHESGVSIDVLEITNV